MKKILGPLVVASLIAGPALAADLPVKAPLYKAPPPVPVYNWTGCYVGLNAGGAWERARNDLTVTNAAAGYFNPLAIPGVKPSGSADLSSSGFTGGGQGGCNWQSGQIVWGVEIDFASLHQSNSYGGRFLYTTNGAPYFLNGSQSTDWLFTARPRIGVAIDRALYFVTGGAAVTNVNFNQTFAEPPFTPTPENATLSKTIVGWTFGAGLEYAFGNNWTIKGEYLFARFATNNVVGTLVNGSGSGPGCVAAFTCGATFNNALSTLNVHVARVGLNYKF